VCACAVADSEDELDDGEVQSRAPRRSPLPEGLQRFTGPHRAIVALTSAVRQNLLVRYCRPSCPISGCPFLCNDGVVEQSHTPPFQMFRALLNIYWDCPPILTSVLMSPRMFESQGFNNNTLLLQVSSPETRCVSRLCSLPM
jgi:hypothetical protein